MCYKFLKFRTKTFQDTVHFNNFNDKNINMSNIL